MNPYQVYRVPSKQEVVNYYNNRPIRNSSVLIQIQNGIARVTGYEKLSTGHEIKRMMDKLQEKYLFLPNATFILSTNDNDNSMESGWEKDIGLGVWHNSSKNKNVLFHPMWYWMAQTKINAVLNKDIPWNEKMNKILWRGVDTGIGWRQFFLEKSQRIPDLVDAKLVTRGEYDPYFMLPTDQMLYKHLVSIDGNGGTYGMYWMLASGSHLFKWSDYYQWYDRITDFKYTNFNENNMYQVFNQIRNPEFDKKFKEQAKISREISKKWFNEKAVLEFLYNQINEYSKLQR